MTVGLKPRAVARCSRKIWAQKPMPIGPVRRFGVGSNVGLTVGGFFPAERAVEAFRERKPPKGESQERCRCETQPARDSRAKTVKRVIKP